jgi:hypothetical protein
MKTPMSDLAEKYRFGYMTGDDMEQEAHLHVLCILENHPMYSEEQILRNLKNRLMAIKYEWIKTHPCEVRA